MLTQYRLILMAAAAAALVPASAYPCSYANGLVILAPRAAAPMAPNHGVVFRVGPYMWSELTRQLTGAGPIPDITVIKLLGEEGEQKGWLRFSQPLTSGQTYTLTVTTPDSPVPPVTVNLDVAGPLDRDPPRFGGITLAAAKRNTGADACATYDNVLDLEWEAPDETVILTIAEVQPTGENPRPFRNLIDGPRTTPNHALIPLGVAGQRVCVAAKAMDLAGNETPYTAPCCVNESSAMGSCRFGSRSWTLEDASTTKQGGACRYTPTGGNTASASTLLAFLLILTATRHRRRTR